eukprot:358316-Chlamydomonas_euryale.AAC.1
MQRRGERVNAGRVERRGDQEGAREAEIPREEGAGHLAVVRPHARAAPPGTPVAATIRMDGWIGGWVSEWMDG